MVQKIYSDVDNAKHAIMLKNLPKTIPAEKLEQIIKEMFECFVENEGLQQEGAPN